MSVQTDSRWPALITQCTVQLMAQYSSEALSNSTSSEEASAQQECLPIWHWSLQRNGIKEASRQTNMQTTALVACINHTWMLDNAHTYAHTRSYKTTKSFCL